MSVAPGAIHHLNCASMCPRGARLLRGEGGLLAPARLVTHCLLIEGADGLVLVDTGFGSGDVAHPRQLGRPFNALVRPALDPAETAVAQLRALGFNPEDVRQIITTHLDLDHSGALPDFPDAEVHVLAAELDAARNPTWRTRMRYVQSHWSHGPRWVTHEAGGEEWLGMQSIRILPGSDEQILLIPLAGHTAGHTGVAIQVGDRWLLHCGDAYFDRRQMERPPHCPPAMDFYQALLQFDGAARRENLERLRELAGAHGDQVRLICSHEPCYFDESAGAAGA